VRVLASEVLGVSTTYLLKAHNVPHGLRDYSLRPIDIPDDQAGRIYTEVAKQFKMDNAQLPWGKRKFRKSLTAEYMVQSARVIGGPQPSEVARMLAVQRASLKADREWLDTTRRKLDDASKRLDAAFTQLRSASSF
jgi:argininosuccinate lyase